MSFCYDRGFFPGYIPDVSKVDVAGLSAQYAIISSPSISYFAKLFFLAKSVDFTGSTSYSQTIYDSDGTLLGNIAGGGSSSPSPQTFLVETAATLARGTGAKPQERAVFEILVPPRITAEFAFPVRPNGTTAFTVHDHCVTTLPPEDGVDPIVDDADYNFNLALFCPFKPSDAPTGGDSVPCYLFKDGDNYKAFVVLTGENEHYQFSCVPQASYVADASAVFTLKATGFPDIVIPMYTLNETSESPGFTGSVTDSHSVSAVWEFNTFWPA